MKRVFAFLVLVLFAVSAQAATLITDIDLSSDKIKETSKFRIEATLKNPESGMVMDFYIDDTHINSVNVGSSGDEYASNEIDLKEDPLECGTHVAKAILKEKDGSEISRLTMEFNVGNLPKIELDPIRPLVGREMKIKLTDPETGSPLLGVGLGLRVFNKNKNEYVITKGSTDFDGTYTYTPSSHGRYDLQIEDKTYCGKVYFEAKNTLNYDGPHPESPIVGELITMAVPMGVEVKVVDSEGDPYLLGFTTIGGGVNLTINKSGDYTLVIGELSSKYWGVNKSITVTDKPTPVVKINPERGVIGRSASIEVLYGSSPLPDASVTIIKPDKSIDSFTTPQSGIVAFTPMVLGEYNIMVEKPRYDSKSVMLMVKNDLSMELNPKAPSAGGNTTITLKNQLGQVVAGAAVSLNGNELGTTNSEGKFTLTIPEPGNYTIKATRKDIMYWDAEVSLVAAAELKVEFSRPNLRAGESTTVEVKDQAGTKLDATIAVKDPAGNAVEVKEGKITPLVPGTHTVTASKEGYGTTVKELVVRPREIEVAWSVKGRNLIIAVSSGGTPLESITVTLKKPVNGTLLTTEDGTVSIPLKKTAEYEIEVNTINQNPGYDTKTEKKLVERDYRLGTLLALIAIILVAAAAVIIIIHKMSGGGGQQTITGSKPPRKTRLQQV